MIKKNAKVLLSYVLGVIITLILTVPLSPLFKLSPKIFSTVTALISVSFIYSEIWNFGKYDALRKHTHLLKALSYLVMYAIVTIATILISTLIKTDSIFNIPLIIGNLWMYPFIGFFTRKTYLLATILSMLFIAVISIAAYYTGSKNFSIMDKILIARKKRIDKKAKKHRDEIEKIKEQYRNK